MSELIQALGINWKLLLAQMVNFGILAFLLTKFLYKPMFKMLDARREKAEELERSAKEVAQARRHMEKWRKQQEQDVQQHADTLLKETSARADVLRQEAVAKTQKEIAAMREKTSRDLEQEKQRIFQETQEELAGLALAAAEKVLGRSTQSEDTERLARQALDELTKKK